MSTTVENAKRDINLLGDQKPILKCSCLFIIGYTHIMSVFSMDTEMLNIAAVCEIQLNYVIINLTCVEKNA